jgi:predicted metalloprotease with PDZ domain
MKCQPGNFAFNAVACALVCAALSDAQPSAVPPGGSNPSSPRDTVSYNISLADPAQHLVEVQIVLPAGRAEHELQLPVWNALYQVRDFSQYVNWVRAKDRAGLPLSIQKLDKSRWEVTAAQNGATVEYEMFVDSAGPFGAQLNPHHAFFNLAEILMYPENGRNAPMTVRFDHVPDGWRVGTPLASSEDGHFSADNYDRLVDSPVEIGDFQESDFEEGGGHYRVIVDADAADYDMTKIVGMLHKITAAATGWMNDRPFDSYLFVYHFPHGPAGGGMEHAFSTAIDVSAESLKGSSTPLEGVTAHEFFHLWNVKRIRPQTLEPVDYTKENYTRALWFSEGVTSSAEGTILLRAGLIDESHYLAQLAGEITELERRPAHLTQSAEESSLDSWLEGDAYYRRPQRSISYYNKGELLGVMLDLKVRELSQGRASLREVLEWMNQNYAKKGRFFADSEGVREAAEAVSHADLKDFFAKYVAGREEIPWNDVFRGVGLRLVESTTTAANAGFSASRNFDGPMKVEAVTAGSEAERAGLEVGDTILEIQGKPAGQDSREPLARLKPGDAIQLKVSSRHGARILSWNVGSHQEITFQLKDVDNLTTEQRARRAEWLKGEAQTSGATRP